VRSYTPEYERQPHPDFPDQTAVHAILPSHNPRLLFFPYLYEQKRLFTRVDSDRTRGNGLKLR